VKREHVFDGGLQATCGAQGFLQRRVRVASGVDAGGFEDELESGERFRIGGRHWR
jgi:hypothetical protein